MPTRLKIRTPSRLHFGLLGWGEHARRQFGGVGLMTEDPGLEIHFEKARRWEAAGPASDRALAIATEVALKLNQEGHTVEPLRIETIRVPEAHVGLGVGTQLSLAVARALTELADLTDTPVETLARLTGRGRRSGIGIHGFERGGLIVDGGRREGNTIPIRLAREVFPAHWSILIVVPATAPGLHGVEEVQAFQTLPPMPEAQTDRLCRLVLLGLLPAVVENDLSTFGSALNEIQHVVGKAFAAIQGGRYAAPQSEAVVCRMTQMGLHGVGQSSWGPALYGFSEADTKERDHFRQQLIQEFHLGPSKIQWTSASASGARCELLN